MVRGKQSANVLQPERAFNDHLDEKQSHSIEQPTTVQEFKREKLSKHLKDLARIGNDCNRLAHDNKRSKTFFQRMKMFVRRKNSNSNQLPPGMREQTSATSSQSKLHDAASFEMQNLVKHLTTEDFKEKHISKLQ